MNVINYSCYMVVGWQHCITFSNHELEDVGMVFPPPLFCKLGIPSHNMIVCSFVSFCVGIPHVHGDF